MTGCGQCNDGRICEDHPDQPMGHGHCGGAGMPCQNPSCPFSVTRTGLVCPKCRRSHGEIEMETHRVIRFRCKSCRYEWYAEHGKVDLELLAPSIDAAAWQEVDFLLKHLEGSGLIETRRIEVPSRDRAPDSPGEKRSLVMTVSGWNAVSPVAGAGIAGTCFIAMSFADELNDAYDNGMIPAIKEDCGFNVIRVDRVEHNDDITDRILAGIRGAQFVVADFTGQRPGVYFEAGFAAGLGRVVIWTCRADEIDRVHFDTRQRNHVVWSTPAELRQKLAQRIRATVALPARLG